jgi:hypothetical protein
MLAIESFRFEHGGCYPQVLYVQLDGGAENANKYVLAFLEMLVVKRIVKRIYYTRLPTGHTHEDIDACFALIWNWFLKQNIISPQDYKSELEKAFADSKLMVSITDIDFIPNYKDWIKPHIDPHIGHLHRLEDTVHQWKFEAVATDTLNYPFGVKTMYRLYASNQIVRIDKRPRCQCSSSEGVLTGLEVSTLLIRWEPALDHQVKCGKKRKREPIF